jgi:hypothetical protein
MSEMMAKEYGGNITRAYGVGNELQGLLMHDLPDLMNRLNGKRHWAFDWMDLAANEAGIASARREREGGGCASEGSQNGTTEEPGK